MSYAETDRLRSGQRQGEDWQGGYQPGALARNSNGLPWGLLMTGLVVVGLGFLAWKTLGPDLKRYLKIKSM